MFHRLAKSNRSASRSKRLGHQRNASGGSSDVGNLGCFRLSESQNWAWCRLGAIDLPGTDSSREPVRCSTDPLSEHLMSVAREKRQREVVCIALWTVVSPAPISAKSHRQRPSGLGFSSPSEVAFSCCLPTRGEIKGCDPQNRWTRTPGRIPNLINLPFPAETSGSIGV